MYPRGELNLLAMHKAALRRDIALHRAQGVAAAVRVTQPLEWLDRVLVFWRRIAPLALAVSVPLSLLGARSLAPRLKILGWLVRWGPLVYGAVGRLRGAAKRRSACAPLRGRG
jgi:hypothetical protein